MRLRSLAVLLLLLPLSSCQNGSGSGASSMTASGLEKTFHAKRANPFQPRKKSWIADKMNRLGLTKDKPAPATQAAGTTTTEAFRSNQ